MHLIYMQYLGSYTIYYNDDMIFIIYNNLFAVIGDRHCWSYPRRVLRLALAVLRLVLLIPQSHLLLILHAICSVLSAIKDATCCRLLTVLAPKTFAMQFQYQLLLLLSFVCFSGIRAAHLPHNAYLPPVVASATEAVQVRPQQQQQHQHQAASSSGFVAHELQQLWLPQQQEYELDLPLESYQGQVGHD